jgi:hypothetical protein
MQDRIERAIVIRAPLNRVWTPVTEPGWWISDEDGDRAAQTRPRQGVLELIQAPGLGRFAESWSTASPWASWRTPIRRGCSYGPRKSRMTAANSGW